LLPTSLRMLRRAAKESEEELEKDYDVIMTCVTTRTTPPIGYFAPTLSYEEIAQRAASFATFLPLFNISGSPGISLPMGETEAGMPVGVQFTAPFGQDKLLLELALELEQAKPWKMIWE
jgi:amidase